MFLILLNSFANMSLKILLSLHFDGGGKFELQKNKQNNVCRLCRDSVRLLKYPLRSQSKCMTVELYGRIPRKILQLQTKFELKSANSCWNVTWNQVVCIDSIIYENETRRTRSKRVSFLFGKYIKKCSAKGINSTGKKFQLLKQKILLFDK